MQTDAKSPPRLILHLDMDAFFAAVEQLDHPEWRGKPVVVGAPPDARGVVSTCSYEARAFGIHSAMPSRVAYRRCPHAIFAPVRGDRYREVSRHIREIFSRFTPYVQPLSIDEAFLDVTGSAHLHGGDVATARELKETIRRETGLTASVGVAPNMFLAKLASDMDKPDGLTVVPRDPRAIADFLAPLPVKRIWGIGPKSAQRLEAVGIHFIRDVQTADPYRLKRLLGDHAADRLKRLAFGVDDRELELEREEKSLSHEHTYDTDCADPEIVRQTLLRLTEKVGCRVRRHGKLARTAQLKLRWADFTTITRQQPIVPPSASDRVFIEHALQLLDRIALDRPVRLIGFGAANLVDGDVDAPTWQPELFDDVADAAPGAAEREGRLDSAVDAIRDRFGAASIRRLGDR